MQIRQRLTQSVVLIRTAKPSAVFIQRAGQKNIHLLLRQSASLKTHRAVLNLAGTKSQVFTVTDFTIKHHQAVGNELRTQPQQALRIQR